MEVSLYSKQDPQVCVSWAESTDELLLKDTHHIDETFSFLLIWLNRTSMFNIYLVQYVRHGAANLKYTILKYLDLPVTEMGDLWLWASLPLSSKGPCVRQKGHRFPEASSAEAPVKLQDGPLKVLQITHLITLSSATKQDLSI